MSQLEKCGKTSDITIRFRLEPGFRKVQYFADKFHDKPSLSSDTKNKFEMFQTIISFINLIPPVFKLAYVQYIKLKS